MISTPDKLSAVLLIIINRKIILFLMIWNVLLIMFHIIVRRLTFLLPLPIKIYSFLTKNLHNNYNNLLFCHIDNNNTAVDYWNLFLISLNLYFCPIIFLNYSHGLALQILDNLIMIKNLNYNFPILFPPLFLILIFIIIIHNKSINNHYFHHNLIIIAFYLQIMMYMRIIFNKLSLKHPINLCHFQINQF